MFFTEIPNKVYTYYVVCYNHIVATDWQIKKDGDDMTEKEMLKILVEEFSRLQDYMIDCDKGSVTYKKMKRRYIELKVILTASGINLAELDFLKE